MRLVSRQICIILDWTLLDLEAAVFPALRAHQATGNMQPPPPARYNQFINSELLLAPTRRPAQLKPAACVGGGQGARWGSGPQWPISLQARSVGHIVNKTLSKLLQIVVSLCCVFLTTCPGFRLRVKGGGSSSAQRGSGSWQRPDLNGRSVGSKCFCGGFAWRV